MIKTKYDEVTIITLILAVVLSNVAPIYYWAPVFAICIASTAYILGAIKINARFTFTAFAFLYFIVVSIWSGHINHIDFTKNGGYEAIGPIVGIFYILMMSLRRVENYTPDEMESKLIIIVLCVLFMDLILRIKNFSGNELSVSTLMHEFKYGGLFPTSNVTGYVGVFGLASALNKNRLKIALLFLALIVLTASRTSMMACFPVFYYFAPIKLLYKIGVLPIALILSESIVQVLNVNWSFESKFEILYNFSEYVKNAQTTELMIGVSGGQNAVWERLAVLTPGGELISPHNPLVKIFMYYGFFGLSILFLSFYKIRFDYLIVYTVHSISGIMPFLPLLYISILMGKKYGKNC